MNTSTRLGVLLLGCGLLAACPDDDAAVVAAGGGTATLQATDLTTRIDHAPIPVLGSDGRYHLTYEIELTNTTADRLTFARVDVRDAQKGTTVASFDAAAVAARMVLRDRAATPGSLGAAQWAFLYLHVAFDDLPSVPRRLEHVLSFTRGTAPAVVTETSARTAVGTSTELVLDAPLRGARYIAGDGCCDSTRHVRATLSVDGGWYTAQRFAIDWEQLDAQGRIYLGDPKLPASYVIYGKPAYAVADAEVEAAVDGLPDTPPGGFPAGITLDQADGNHVVLNLGDGRYALYAHFRPGSVKVSKGDRVRRGQVLGEVGTSGNSSEPHLHFHVMDGPSALASNGLPYRLRSFTATSKGVSTAAFDQAIIDGKPIATEAVAGAALRERVMPMDLWIVDLEVAP